MAKIFYTKMGKDIEIHLNTPHEYKVGHKFYDPLSSSRIVGIDTETIMRGDVSLLKYVQVDTEQGGDVFDIEVSQQNGMEILFTWLLENYGENYKAPSDIKQRSKTTRKNTKKRDGRRVKVTPVILAFFNMDYDLGRLITSIPVFRRNLAYGSDSFTFQYHHYTVEIVYSCLGVACPSFQWYVTDVQKKKVVRLIGFDSTSYFKSSLKRVTASLSDLGVTQKIDQDGDIFTRDWSTNEPSEQEIENFLQYARTDAKAHREIYNAIVTLLTQIDSQIIDRLGSIPSSAPAAAARIMMHKSSLDCWEAPATWVQQIGMDGFKGAISFCCYPGYVDDVGVADISSAYPHVMTLLPNLCTVEYRRVKQGIYHQENYVGRWGVLVISGESFDDMYPPLVSYVEGKQRGIVGKFQKFTATIPEITIGVARGALRVDKIHDGCIMVGSNEGSNLKAFIEYVYQIKSSSDKNSPMYMMAKLLMNSLYGKLIEKRHQFSAIPTIDENGNHMIIPNIEDEKIKVQIKDLYLKEGFEAVEVLVSDYCAQHKIVQMISLAEYLSFNKWESGYYFNSLLAGQITGFTRGKLMAAAHYLGAYFGDTDSLFCDSTKLHTDEWEAFISYLNSVGAITPPNGLGSFEIEAHDCHALLVKKKLYCLVKEDGSIKKMGHHGISGVPGDDLIFSYMKELYEKKSFSYETKPRPTRIKEGLRTGKEIGRFIRKRIKLTLTNNPYQKMDDMGWLHWI
jgi:hypothetical protein